MLLASGIPGHKLYVVNCCGCLQLASFLYAVALKTVDYIGYNLSMTIQVYNNLLR